MFKRKKKDGYSILMTKKEYNQLINKAYMDGYSHGFDAGQLDASMRRFSPNEIIEIIGLQPVEKEE